MQYFTAMNNACHAVLEPVQNAMPGNAAVCPKTAVCSLILMVFTLLVPVAATAEMTANTVEQYLQESEAAGKKANRLIEEVSPYLLQHAYNPVQWYAWGEEAFDRARRENKPIFLSIGYSTCHWCHVMAHESFESTEIASILNSHFISIKVDREERPDIDTVYMSATQLLNGYGGWPMTVFINHDLEPFYAGTYYPPDSKDGRRGLKQILLEIHRLWQDERARVESIADNVAGMVRRASEQSVPAESLDNNVDGRALKQLSASFDEEYGGFGSAPKFPGHGIHAFLLRQLNKSNEDGERARNMLSRTLGNMAHGGIFDQLGGGFHRYSVDAEWRVPHFEKMLYSQALLALVYMRFYQFESKPLYRKVAQATLDFVLREMTSPQGGFYSALDADSERIGDEGPVFEGAYYLWSEKQLSEVLSGEELLFIRDYYSTDESGNIGSDPHNQFANMNVFYIDEEFRGRTLTKKRQLLLDSARNKLFQYRLQRPRPHLDDKIITAWNGMMIAALTKASVILEERKYLGAAVRAANYLRQRAINKKNGTLFRRVRREQAGVQAGLSDYVWFIHGLIALYEQTRERQWLESAIALSDMQNELFLDKAGGYFDASEQDPNLLFRSKSIHDSALPAANAIAYSNLHDLFRITGHRKWKQQAEDMRVAFAGTINASPVAAAMFLSVSAGESE